MTSRCRVHADRRRVAALDPPSRAQLIAVAAARRSRGSMCRPIDSGGLAVEDGAESPTRAPSRISLRWSGNGQPRRRAWYPDRADDDARYDALATRDPRFDGVFFVGVSTTGIYCRPICPARTPGRDALRVLRDAGAGRGAPGSARASAAGPSSRRATREVDAVDALVAAATQRIAEGALNDGSRRRARGGARRVGAAPAARDRGEARRVAGRARAEPAARAREAAAAGHRAAADRDRVRGRVRQRAPVQRRVRRR